MTKQHPNLYDVLNHYLAPYLVTSYFFIHLRLNTNFDDIVFHKWWMTPLSMWQKKEAIHPSTWPQKKEKFDISNWFNFIEWKKNYFVFWTFWDAFKCYLNTSWLSNDKFFLRFFFNLKMKRNTKRVSWLFKQIMFDAKLKRTTVCTKGKKIALNDLTWHNKTWHDKQRQAKWTAT